jgi:signal transduction histidine kinase
MEKQTLFSRLSAASVIALTDRYRFNPYVRSTVNIILLQVLLALLIVLAFNFALEYQEKGILGSVANVLPGTPASESVRRVSNTALQFALLGIVLLTIGCGYLTARYALRPARNSLQFQKRFIGNMAHELRTPLAIIKTNTEVALMDPDVSLAMREVLETTSSELDRISETINNLLSFETMVRPSKVSLAELDLKETAEKVVARHEALARSRGITLTCNASGSHFIRANATGIEQVFTNLIKNAINYTPQNSEGSVTVTLQGTDREATISVADTGIGIAKNDLYYIFQPFYRADTSRARGVGGGTSGLGLAIVNEIVRAHQGRIFIRSALNRGTTVEVTFPKIRRSEAEDEESMHELRVG